MTFHAQFERLPAFLESLTALPSVERRDAIANEVIESGGTYTAPLSDWPEGLTFLYEISLHGVTALGTSEDEAIRNWIDLASHFTVPFPTPRNHAEEIENARAIAKRNNWPVSPIPPPPA